MKKITVTLGIVFILIVSLGFFIEDSQDELKQAPQNPAFLRALEKIQKGEFEWVSEDGSNLGHIPGPVNRSYLYNTAPSINTGQVLAPPTSYDLRTTGRVTSVKNQASCGSCWSFAGVGSVESYLRTGETRNFAEQHLNGYHPFDWLECSGGNSDMIFAMWGNWNGPYNETDFPYPYSSDSMTINAASTQKHIQKVLWPPNDATTLKNLVMSGGGVYVSYYWNSSYHNYTTKAYYYTGSADCNHAVLLAGWDDNFPASSFNTTPAGNGAWLIKNSWGESHSSTDGTGYSWISYYDTKFGSPAAFHNAEATSNYSSLYAYDSFGWVGSWNPTWGANIFTASANHTITAAGILPTAGCNYTIKVYTGCTASNPVSGTLASTNSGSVTMAGYYTIPLSTPVNVTSGQRFSVVVQYTGGSSYPLATEQIYTGYSSACSSNSGESFYSFNGTTWSDWYSTHSSDAINNIIKAYVGGQSAKNDFNGDGQGDILWRNYSSGANAVWYLQSTGLTARLRQGNLQSMTIEPGQEPARTFQNPWEAGEILYKDERVYQDILEVDVPQEKIEAKVYKDALEAGPVFYRPGAKGIAGDIQELMMPGDHKAGVQALSILSTAYLNTISNTSWHIEATGDLNGDGRVDILWRHYGTGQNAVWYMNGSVISGTAYLTTITDTLWRIEGAADFNGDGNTDLLWRHYGTGKNALWYMSGPTIISTTYLGAITDTNWRIEATGDFNGDGNTDFVWRNYGTGQNALWYMSGSTHSGTVFLTAVADVYWAIAGAGDFNRDGNTDLLWRHYTAGANSVWYMSGTTITGTEALTAVGDLNWKIENH